MKRLDILEKSVCLSAVPHRAGMDLFETTLWLSGCLMV